jgi:hypothetical protein
MRFTGVVCLGALLLGTACQWAGLPARAKVYAAHEAGLTLQYENPQLAPEARFGERIQARVAASKDVEEGRAVRITYTSLRGESSALFFQKDGGLFLSQDGKTPGLLVYPAGFPDGISQWEVRGTKFRVLGRAVADLHGLKLPDTADRVGVWVEFESAQGLRQRTFLLPDIGEAETLTWHKGAWISTHRLVSRGFTDAPVVHE